MTELGVEPLVRRLEQQRHWQQAVTVREGKQPPIDPDGADLEEIRSSRRVYRRTRRQYEMIDGRAAFVTRRLQKDLQNGAWVSDMVVEGVEELD